MANVAEGEEGGTKTNAATNQRKMKEDEITMCRRLL